VKYVVDAKYKEVLYDGNELSVSQADIYQMLAYSVRYACDNIALIYPKLLTDEHCELLIQEFKIENYERVVSIKLIQVDLEIEASQLARDLANALGYCNEGYETPIKIS
jgi:5-methylcytosine-specific restriction enzyme subunit McrC